MLGNITLKGSIGGKTYAFFCASRNSIALVDMHSHLIIMNGTKNEEVNI